MDNTIHIVQNQWGGNSAPWNPGGTWIIGCRVGQHVVDVNVTSADGGNSLTGTMTYNGEGPIGFKSQQSAGGVYNAQNQWGGDSAPWHPGGTWVMGCRDGQNVMEVKISSADGGKTFSGSMTYAGEGPIGLNMTMIS